MGLSTRRSSAVLWDYAAVSTVTSCAPGKLPPDAIRRNAYVHKESTIFLGVGRLLTLNRGLPVSRADIFVSRNAAMLSSGCLS